MSLRQSLSAIGLVLAFLSFMLSGCNRANQPLTFSQLLSQAGNYNGRTVTLDAFYFSGFEISALSGSLGPSSAGIWRIVPVGPLVWVQGGIPQEVLSKLSSQSDTPSGYAEHFGKLRVTGKFESGGKYGHLDSFDYRITVTAAELLDWTPPPAATAGSPSTATRSSAFGAQSALDQAKTYQVVEKGNLANDDPSRTAGLWYITAPEAQGFEEYAQTAIQATLDLYSLYKNDFTAVMLIPARNVYTAYAETLFAADGKGAWGMTGSVPAVPKYWKVRAMDDIPYSDQELVILALWQEKQADFPSRNPLSSLSYDEENLRQYIAEALGIPLSATDVRPLKKAEYGIDQSFGSLNPIP
jgi:hypothetical protein